MAVVLMSHKYSSKESPHKRGVVLFFGPGASPQPLEMRPPASSEGEVSWWHPSPSSPAPSCTEGSGALDPRIPCILPGGDLPSGSLTGWGVGGAAEGVTDLSEQGNGGNFVFVRFD